MFEFTVGGAGGESMTLYAVNGYAIVPNGARVNGIENT